MRKRDFFILLGVAGRGVGIALFLALSMLVVACSLGAGQNGAEQDLVDSSASLGDVVTTGTIGTDNAPQAVSARFATDAPIIYAVTLTRRVEPGTAIFARWSKDEVPLEDSTTVVADRLIENTYLEFHLEPTGGTTLEPGNYAVQLYVNGNEGPRAAFTVGENVVATTTARMPIRNLVGVGTGIMLVLTGLFIFRRVRQ